MRISPLNQLLLPLLLALTVFPVQAAPGDVVGRVITQTGEVAAVRPDGERRSLARRDPVYEGDTLVTGEPGRAQIRFKDRGLTDLRPGTRFEIEQYRAGEATGDQEKNVAVRLIEGGLRTITGAVGQEEKKNYRMDTPVASIGIRGTQYQVNYCQSDCGDGAPGLYGGVAGGAIGVANQAGSRTFGQDHYFYVASTSQAPQGLLAPPTGVLGRFSAGPPPGGEPGEDGEEGEGTDTRQGTLAALGESEEALQEARSGLVEEEFEAGESATEEISQSTSPQLWLWGASYLISGSPPEGFAGGGDPAYGSTININEAGHVTALMTYTASGTLILDFAADPGATPAETGSDTSLGVHWGRWKEGDYSADNATLTGDAPTGDFHYAYATDITTDTELSALGGTGTYAWNGGTTPTDSNGNHWSLDQFTMQVDFDSAAITSSTLRVIGAGTIEGTYDASLDDPSMSASFGRKFTITMDTGSAGDCGSCARVVGAFVGSKAEGAYVNFAIGNYTYYVVGAGSLEKQ